MPASSGGFDATVGTVPMNIGSFDETVLRVGPWQSSLSKATLAAEFPTMTTCTGSGSATFRAIGSPSDAEMFAANRRHEDHHASDHEVAFNATIAPWDAKLTAAKLASTRFHGATAVDAEAALWAAMGGTPDQIADAYSTASVNAARAYHASPAGGPLYGPISPSANATCSTASASYSNPS